MVRSLLCVVSARGYFGLRTFRRVRWTIACRLRPADSSQRVRRDCGWQEEREACSLPQTFSISSGIVPLSGGTSSVEDLPLPLPPLRLACAPPATHCVSALALQAGFQALPRGGVESVFSALIEDNSIDTNIRLKILIYKV
jgi:hypothetical protein